ncbi:hypothetical protein [Nocardia abscessus]|uniref:VG15 protein n=1 Tax=Nocardia abscessus TaxID=120957 RepID=UPI002454488D|nr:hypothetical protein [Nocardia abscessus]
MTPDEYSVEQTVISAGIANYVLQLAKFFASPILTLADWLRLLELLFPQVQQERGRAAELARAFYDSQRALHHPELPRNDQFLVEYPFEQFVENLEPLRRQMSQEDTPEHVVGSLALRVVREVENGARRQIIRSVESDPAPRIVKGWARVATGRETCGWCLMLISRGPVYTAADTAGLDLDDRTAARMIAAGEDVSEYMEQWHDGCDCKVVPVFKHENWPGQKAADRALELWNEAATEAVRFRAENPGRKHTTGKNRGKEFTFNEDVILVLRRRLERGEINPAEYAGFAA